MLIRFNIKNFLSFSSRGDGKSQEFSMIAGKVRSKKEHIYGDENIKLLKFAAVYGANASGKSNLVKAIDFMKRIIVKGLPEGHTDKYCKVNPENEGKESYFEIEIMMEKKYYAYGFEIILSKSEFISEWLIELGPDNQEKMIFNRDIKNGKFELGNDLNSEGLSKKISVYAEDIQDDGSVLLLSVMNQNKKNLYQEYDKAIILKEVYGWVNNSLDINYPDMPLSDYSYMAKTENIQEICRIISAFGTGITNFEMVDVPVETVVGNLPKSFKNSLISEIERSTINVNNDKNISSVGIVMRSNKDFFVIKINKDEKVECKTIQFYHGEKNVLFNLSEESDGTIRILDLLEILLTGEGKTYIVDELDRCLHPSMTYKFIETFFQIAAKKNIQLVVTTHESRLMDFDLLRRDEIWFIDKNKLGESKIYSLEEYNARFDQKIDKAYLEGRYGGIPIFTTVFPVEEE